ncbi:hypothetical protein Tco_1089160 [Tanacetum coccineum]
MKASETRTASPSYSTLPLSPDHPLTQISPTPIPSRASYYRSTTRMIMRTKPTMSSGFSARVIEAMNLSPLSFQEESEEAASEEQQQQPVSVEDTAADEHLVLGYGVAKRHALKLAKGYVPSTFKVGQSSRSVPD